jgi:hypothetical protein
MSISKARVSQARRPRSDCVRQSPRRIISERHWPYLQLEDRFADCPFGFDHPANIVSAVFPWNLIIPLLSAILYSSCRSFSTLFFEHSGSINCMFRFITPPNHNLPTCSQRAQQALSIIYSSPARSSMTLVYGEADTSLLDRGYEHDHIISYRTSFQYPGRDLVE